MEYPDIDGGERPELTLEIGSGRPKVLADVGDHGIPCDSSEPDGASVGSTWQESLVAFRGRRRVTASSLTSHRHVSSSCQRRSTGR